MRRIALSALLVLAASLGGVGARTLWPTDPHLSGSAFLTPGLAQLQDDPATSPIGLWLQRGAASWSASAGGASCQSCHGDAARLAPAVARFPRLAADGRTLINLEDQIRACRTRSGRPQATAREDEDVLALSAYLHMAARGQRIAVQAPTEPTARASWETRLASGAQAWSQRVGRIHLACMHCHDHNVGKTFRSEVTSPAHPVGMPVYRMRWQTLGSLERRVRACYSGVQAEVPAAHDPLLRDLELFLKVRANGMALEGPSIRR